MKSYIEPTETYYDLYERVANTSRNYFREALDDVERSLSQILKKQCPLTIVALGSATGVNIEVLRQFVKKRRLHNDFTDQDRFIFLDLSQRALRSHKERVDSKSYSDVFVTQGDMNAAPIKSTSADLIIVDYTINFNRNSLDYKRTIQTIARLLTSDGACVLTVLVLPEGAPEKLEELPDKDIKITKVNREYLFSLLSKANLDCKKISEFQDTGGSNLRLLITRHVEGENKTKLPRFLKNFF